jgi:hypothetical protein
MTHTMTSQNIDISSWYIFYRKYHVYHENDERHHVHVNHLPTHYKIPVQGTRQGSDDFRKGEGEVGVDLWQSCCLRWCWGAGNTTCIDTIVNDVMQAIHPANLGWTTTEKIPPNHANLPKYTQALTTKWKEALVVRNQKSIIQSNNKYAVMLNSNRFSKARYGLSESPNDKSDLSQIWSVITRLT